MEPFYDIKTLQFIHHVKIEQTPVIFSKGLLWRISDKQVNQSLWLRIQSVSSIRNGVCAIHSPTEKKAFENFVYDVFDLVGFYNQVSSEYGIDLDKHAQTFDENALDLSSVKQNKTHLLYASKPLKPFFYKNGTRIKSPLKESAEKRGCIENINGIVISPAFLWKTDNALGIKFHVVAINMMDDDNKQKVRAPLFSTENNLETNDNVDVSFSDEENGANDDDSRKIQNTIYNETPHLHSCNTSQQHISLSAKRKHRKTNTTKSNIYFFIGFLYGSSERIGWQFRLSLF
jgi:hypothetical protein